VASPTLRYFDCRSRGQALRFALEDAGVAFEDERIPLADLAGWRERKEDPEVGGPFASLPVLRWGDHVVAQTLAVAAYLSERLGHADRLSSAEARAFDAMVVSAAHLDMQAPYSGLLWLAADAPDEQLRAVARGLLDAVGAKLAQLERLHEGALLRGPFFGDAAPSMADFFVYESIDRARAVFGRAFAPHLAGAERMRALVAALEKRPRIAACLAARRVAERVTSSPSEPRVRDRVRALADDGRL
jgi:glutathione S-transferase